MRSLLLFIGSLLYPTVMVVISPLLVFLYLLFGTVLLARYLHGKMHVMKSILANVKFYHLQFPYKKQLAFRPKAVRLH